VPHSGGTLIGAVLLWIFSCAASRDFRSRFSKRCVAQHRQSADEPAATAEFVIALM